MDIENLSNESDSLATDSGYDLMVLFDEDDDDDGLMHLNVEVVELFERLLLWLDHVQQQNDDILQDWMIDDE